MPENTLLLFEALALLFEDIAKGLIPSHVAAFVFRKMREHEMMALEDVPISEWISPSTDEHEWPSELHLFCADVFARKLDAAEATNHIKEVHAHIERARVRILHASLEDLGCQPSHISFLRCMGVHNLQRLTTLRAMDLAEGRGKSSHHFVSTVTEWACSIPLFPGFAVSA